MSLLSARQDEEVMAEINITPFTDVLLVLLIIFMILAALVTPPGFQKELPANSNPSTINQQNKQDIEVDVTAKNLIYVDGKKTSEKQLYTAMDDVKKQRGNRHVSIVADAKSGYGVIIRILDAAKLAGLTDVGFVSQ
ncbi:MAG TPA: biopolymer transporter ExbD [Candidatus Dormibacteraeota bacterium]|nr:biopolymer transporter ExbD [Candidatus Dormibacteraeota bacterium]